MSTVDKATADDVIAGKYDSPREPQVVAIVKYENAFDGSDAYKLCYDLRMFDYCTDPEPENRPYIINPSVYWRRGK